MSVKRTSSEDGVVQEGDKHFKLSSSGDTGLQDLPLEILEQILETAITLEVHSQKLAKNVWSAKAHLVIKRLRCVCVQWDTILRNSIFLDKLYKLLDDTERSILRMEIVVQSRISLQLEELGCPYIVSLKEDVFVLYKVTASSKSQFVMFVYDRNKTTGVKDEISLPGVHPAGMAACSISSAIYVLDRRSFHRSSVLKITKGEDEYSVSVLLSDLWLPNPTLSLSLNGNLILSMEETNKQLVEITQYDSNGSMQHRIRSIAHISKVKQIISKPNGNYVVISATDRGKTLWTEIDLSGRVIRQHRSPIDAGNTVCNADIYGRLFSAEGLNAVELLDTEFNQLEFVSLNQDKKQLCCQMMSFNSERNEVIALVKGNRSPNDLLTIFRFREE